VIKATGPHASAYDQNREFESAHTIHSLITPSHLQITHEPILLFAACLLTLMNPMSPAFSLKHCRHMFKSYLRIRPWPLPVVTEKGGGERKEGKMMSAASI